MMKATPLRFSAPSPCFANLSELCLLFSCVQVLWKIEFLSFFCLLPFFPSPFLGSNTLYHMQVALYVASDIAKPCFNILFSVISFLKIWM